MRRSLWNSVQRHGLDSSGSGQGLVVVSCENDNESSGVIKFKKLLDQLTDFYAF
jgi:hypothetical protein